MAKSETEKLSSSLSRTILGVLSAIIGILGVGMARELPTGRLGTGILGVAISLTALFVILYLLLEGIDEGGR